MKTVDYLVVTWPRISLFAVVILVFSILAIVIATSVLLLGIQPVENSLLDIITVFLFSVVMLGGAFCMFFFSASVISAREKLVDWGLFLFVIWLFPFFGVLFLVGGKRWRVRS